MTLKHLPAFPPLTLHLIDKRFKMPALPLDASQLFASRYDNLNTQDNCNKEPVQVNCETERKKTKQKWTAVLLS